jgi:hypothetical protein
MNRTCLVCILAVLLNVFAFLLGDTTEGLEFKVTIRAVGEGIEYNEESLHRWWQGRWSESTAEGALILDMEGDRLYLVDHATQTWFGGPIAESLAEMRREIQLLSNKVRETYRIGRQAVANEKKNPFLGKVDLDYQQREKVQGRSCLKYRLLIQNELKHEIWLDDRIRPGNFLPLDRLLPVLKDFQAVTAVFAREFEDTNDYLLEQAIQSRLLELFATGLEISSREYRNGKMVYEKLTADVDDWRGEPEDFQPPEGYRQIDYRQFLENSLPTITDFLEPDEREKH